jgi:hypothetical protein
MVGAFGSAGFSSMYITDFWKDKALRADYFYRFIYGHVKTICGACSGSGYYDNTGSPPCGCCEGTKYTKEKGPKWHPNLFQQENPRLHKIHQQIILKRGY